jgi:hypothetical protein
MYLYRLQIKWDYKKPKMVISPSWQPTTNEDPPLPCDGCAQFWVVQIGIGEDNSFITSFLHEIPSSVDVV